MSIHALAALRHAPVAPSAQAGSLLGDSYFGPYVAVAYVGSLAGGVSGAYHGYKRNDSVGSAIGWGILGSIFWPITIPISLAQGFGQPEKK